MKRNPFETVIIKGRDKPQVNLVKLPPAFAEGLEPRVTVKPRDRANEYNESWGD